MPTKANVLRIATRSSELAMWQANYVKTELENYWSDLTVELLPMTTEGDKILDKPLSEIGGKGLFIKELEKSLYDYNADIAVHSMKDVPGELPQDLILPVMMERGNPYDAFVSNDYESLDDLPDGAIVGTSSMRRKAQILAFRPDLEVRSLRGNVTTRLQKLDDGEFDAIILAMAGLQRLGLENRICDEIAPEIILPAVGQGALGIECRAEDKRIHHLIGPLNDKATHTCVRTERSLNYRLEGDCQSPIAAFAELEESRLMLRALVSSEDGEEVIKSEIIGDRREAVALGRQLADQLIERGASDLIKHASPEEEADTEEN